MVDGLKGVIVPGDDGEMPFQLEHRQGTRIEKKTTEDVSEEEDANAAYATLRNQLDADRKEVAVGAMKSVMDEITPPNEEEQAMLSAKASMRKKQRLKEEGHG